MQRALSKYPRGTQALLEAHMIAESRRLADEAPKDRVLVTSLAGLHNEVAFQFNPGKARVVAHDEAEREFNARTQIHAYHQETPTCAYV